MGEKRSPTAKDGTGKSLSPLHAGAGANPDLGRLSKVSILGKHLRSHRKAWVL